jgi:hypothetical protein
MGKDTDLENTSSSTGPNDGNGAANVGQFDHLLDQAKQSLSRLEPRPPMKFSFIWRGRPFSARLEPAGKSTRLELRGDLGVVPFSAENAAGRRDLFSLANGNLDDPAASFHIDGDQRVFLLGEIDIQGHLSAAAIFGWTARLVLQLRIPMEVVTGYCPSPALDRSPAALLV